MNPDRREDEELFPELPVLDDDGSLFEGHDEELASDESKDLDDATSESDALERFGAFGGVDEEGSLLDYADASETLPIDEERELLASAEIGLLDDSDEGDGRDVTADEAGVLADDESELDDGGAEGTGEDPAGSLDAVDETGGGGDVKDDEGIDDDARFEDSGSARVRERLEREPWPSRADAAWTISRAERVSFEGGATSVGLLVVATRNGALLVSTDGGEQFVRVPGCSGVTAAAIHEGHVIAALHDSARDASAIVLVRVADRMVAELVADFLADDADEDVRVESLAVRANDGRVEVLARGPFGALLVTSRGRG